MTMTRFKGTLNGQPAQGIIDEYLRRNLLHCAAVGAEAGARVSLARIRKWKKPPKWLVASLEGVYERAVRVSAEMAFHRNEVRGSSEERKP